MTKKKKSKIKSFFIKAKRSIKWYKTSILLFIALLLFPLVIGLFYKIPINFVDIEIGDLLSFYAVALGLFATYLTYRETENINSLARQESLRPKIEFSLELDGDEIESKVHIYNSTDNDYVIVYIGHDYYEDEKKRYLNAKSHLDFTIDSWDEVAPESVQVGVKDTDGNEWVVGFEYQENSAKYCRTFMDPIA